MTAFLSVHIVCKNNVRLNDRTADTLIISNIVLNGQQFHRNHFHFGSFIST